MVYCKGKGSPSSPYSNYFTAIDLSLIAVNVVENYHITSEGIR